MQKKINRRSDQRTPGAAVVTLSGKTTLSHWKSFIAPNQNLTPEARLVVVFSIWDKLPPRSPRNTFR